jgi:hypothetical protein
MFAVINVPGSHYFHSYGPGTRKECQEWIDRTVEQLLRTTLLSSTLPRQIISNKEASRWKYRDGSRVFEYFR